MKQKKQKKRGKGSLFFLVGVLLFTVTLLVVACLLLHRVYIQSHYPIDVLDDTCLMPQYMDSKQFKELVHVSEDVQQEAFTLYSKDNETSLNYESDVYARIGSNVGDGTIVIAHGTGDIHKSIGQYISACYEFIGGASIKTFDELVYEQGYHGGYAAEYSGGKADIANFFLQDGLHLTAIEYQVRDGEYLVLIYASSEYKEMEQATLLLKAVGSSLLEGNGEVYLPGEITTLQNSTVSLPKTEDSKASEPESLVLEQEPTEDNVTLEDINSDNGTWIETYAENGGLSTMGEPVREEEGDMTTMECTATVTRDYEQLMFVYQCIDGIPMEAILFSPDFSQYYEPVRYDSSDGKYYFFVKQPQQGLWRGVLKLKDCKEYGILNYYHVTDEEAEIFGNSVSDLEVKDVLEDTVEDADSDGIELEILENE